MKKQGTVKSDYGNRVGLDFGTTYSVISRIKEKQGRHISVEACALREGGARTEIQDSIVLKNRDGQLLFGPSARGKVGRNETVTYTGFKMMLAETDKSVLSQRHYDDEITPKRIVKEYLDDLLTQYVTRSNENRKIEKLVVGVPEIWFTRTLTIDCRTALKDIIQGFDYVEEVEVVSEPAAACAYFVQNYYESTGKKYEGKILIADYGGGTLDIALCDVKGNGTSSEVKAIARAGEGWNTQGTVGKAGMAFMEEIVKIALRKEGLNDSEIVSDQKFFRCVHYIEQELMNRVEEIKKALGKKYRLKLETPEEIVAVFDSFEYKDNDINVTYGMLVQAYNNIIRDLLDKKLDEIIDYMNSKGINYKGGRKEDDFKIALVGGFCNFFLTEYQIKEKFESVFGTEDKRYKDIIADKSDCEKAISYGAALIANGIIEFKQIAPYSLGFASKSGKSWFAINKGEDIEFGKVKMFVDTDGTEMLFRGDSIPLIAFNFDDNPDLCEAKEPLREYQDKLKLEKGRIYKFGYSLDQSMIISLHKWVVPDRNNPDIVEDETKIVLDEIYKMMGNLMAVTGGGKK